MKFSFKIFISVFLALLLVGTGSIWVAHQYVRDQARDEYIARYSSFSKVMGDALNRLDVNTESLMKNAAQVVANRDSVEGLLSTEQLKKMRDDLSVTHIFMVNRAGAFIRSTNENPKLIPNAYSFCQEYRNLVTGKSNVEATPVVHPRPEPKPYKFLFLPTANRQRLVEIGVRVDFIGKTLIEATGADPNIISMSLYSPVGEVFGRFRSTGVEFSGGKVDVPSVLPQMFETSDKMSFFTKVASSHPRCCQCDVSGVSKNGEYYYVLESEVSKHGEYYYVLESEVSKHGLTVVQATMNKMFLLLAIANLILSFFVSRFLSRRLVRNIEKAVSRLRAIKAGGIEKRIGLTGKDEVAYLTNEFDTLLDSLEESQSKIVETEKLRAKVQLAREVAHNIKSPTVAIEMIMPMLKSIPDGIQKVLRDSANDIRKLTDRLLHQADVDNKSIVAQTSGLELVRLKDFLEDVVHEKSYEHSDGQSFIVLHVTPESADPLVSVDPVEFKAVLSNLINNAFESYKDHKGSVRIVCTALDDRCSISIKDRGKGISDDVLRRIGHEEISVGKVQGKGIGLLHAFRTIKDWQGEIQIQSAPEEGTQITILLPSRNVSATSSAFL